MKHLLSFLTLALISAGAVQAQPADKVFINAYVWTVDEQQPVAEAIAVLDGKILAVTSNEQIRNYIDANTRVIDAGGKLILPGFIDNHTHFTDGGFQLQSIDLRHAQTQEEFARLIGEWAERHPRRWITGGTWDHDNFPDGSLPTKELIDPYTPDTPVFVRRYDGHMGLVNSHTLRLAGITRDTPDPPGGQIVRDPDTGEPTGILRNAAMDFVTILIPETSLEDLIDAAHYALEEARKNGVTGIHDMSSPDDLRAYQRLYERGELTTRVYAILPFSQWEHLAGTGIEAPFGNDFIRIGGLKAMADGSLGSSTALFFEPYTSDPTTHGLPSDIMGDGRLERWALAADKAGLQPVIHAIGDSANSLILDLYDRIIRENPVRDRRFRIEHAQHIHPGDFERFAELGVIASVHPYHAIDDGRWAEGRIGHERCKTTYPFRSFLDAGVIMSFGSDWTVAPLNPLLAIYASVTRRTLDGEHPDGWFPEQKITVEEAIKAHTLTSAYSAYDEDTKGSITVGKLADFVILSENILQIDPVAIKDVTVEMTVVGGKIVFGHY
jgi:predicted amidohydrolase YtcJ